MFDTVLLGLQELGLPVWIKNLFKPMFGQQDWQGRIISFFMRLAQIIIRFIIWLFWIIFSVAVFVIWIVVPIFIVWQVLYNTGIVGEFVWRN